MPSKKTAARSNLAAIGFGFNRILLSAYFI
jgi:hypothetical protein